MVTWRYMALLVIALVTGVLGLAMMAGPVDAPVGSRDVTYPLVDPFTVMLRDGHIAAVGVALMLPAGEVPSSPAADAGLLDDPTVQPEEAPEDATVREVVSEVLARSTRDEVLSRRRRERLERRVLRRVRARTHPAAKAVFFTDVAVK